MRKPCAAIFGLLTLFCQPISAEITAEIIPNSAPFALTLEQARNWTPKSQFASSENVASIALARRIDAQLHGGKSNLDTRAKVLYAPDGMNNFGNYLQTQPKFNLYNFTHWAQIDVLNWFAGTADHTVQIPAKPWVDTAHKNGVKVIGSVFLAVAQWGGNPDTVETFLEQDQQGRFVFAHRLVEIANYYGFDGWLMNQETNLTAVKDENNQLVKGQSNPKRGAELGEKMLQFMQYLTAIAPQGMEIHWYDAMLRNGQVKWQNEINANNEDFLQGAVPSADAIFVNYWWNREMVLNSHKRVKALQRSPYDVYFGADLWPSRNAQRAFSRSQWLEWLFDPETGEALSSIALFAPNLNFNFEGESHTPAFSQFKTHPDDYRSFYATEQRLFSGDDLNSATKDKQGWSGIDSYLAAKSAITSLPLVTHFNTGQGKFWFEQGQAKSGPWTNINKQNLLPTWQFAVLDEDLSSSIQPYYNFEQAYQGGSALSIEGQSGSGKSIIPLFFTHVQTQQVKNIEIVAQGDTADLSVYTTIDTGEVLVYKLKNAEAKSDENGWQRYRFVIPNKKPESITQVGLQLTPNTGQPVNVTIGKLALY
jgi:endo-beta-N-acetylglucosaminidase D